MSDTIQRKFIVLPSSGGVTDVAATAPIVSSGGATPNISITPGGTPGDTLIWDGSAWVVTMPGSGHTLVYTDLVPTSAQTSWFNNWTAMMAVYEALDEPKQIALWQTNPAVPLVAGVPVFPHALWWDVGCLVAVNPPGEPCSLALPDGAFIKGLHTVGSGVTIGTSGTQPAGLFLGPPFGGLPHSARRRGRRHAHHVLRDDAAHQAVRDIGNGQRALHRAARLLCDSRRPGPRAGCDAERSMALEREYSRVQRVDDRLRRAQRR